MQINVPADIFSKKVISLVRLYKGIFMQPYKNALINAQKIFIVIPLNTRKTYAI